MTNSKNIPKRRFKEFELLNGWVERKLGLIAKYRRGSFPQPYGKKEWYDGPGAMPFVQVVDVSNNLRLVEDTKQKISKIAQDKSVFVPKNTVIVTLQGSIGRVAVTQYDSFVDRTLLIFEDYNLKTDPLFWAYSIQGKFDEESKRAPGGTIKTITKEALSSFDILLPSISEQKSIGKFFQTIDSLIALHQHKLDKLKNLKKAYLAELFPAEGERIPKRRFPDFEGEWEEKKLASIASMHARIGWQNLRTSEFLDHGDYYLITGTDFLDGHINFDKCHYVDEKRFQQDKNIQVVNGSILITKDGTLGKVAIVNNLDKPATLNAGVFNVVVKDSNIDVKYLYQYLAAPYLMNYVSKRATGGTIKHLNQNILVDFPIYFPEYKEQKTIGNFLEKLDESISLQQQKLDKLKDLKKAYLNELFV